MIENPILCVFGEPIEIVVTSRSTNYTCCAGIQTSPPGGGPPPHKHEREEEIFMVLDGTFEFFDGHEWTPFGKGEIKCSNRGQYHGFRNSGLTSGRMFFVVNSGGLDEYFALISPLELPRDEKRLVEISQHFGYTFLPIDSDLAERT